MNSLRLAIGFMSILPVAPRDTPMQLASARAYFPLVGLILGGILGVLDLVLRPVLPALLLSTVLVTALIVLTRALHMDGFMDSCDALLGGFNLERRLEILKVAAAEHSQRCSVVRSVDRLEMKNAVN